MVALRKFKSPKSLLFGPFYSREEKIATNNALKNNTNNSIAIR